MSLEALPGFHIARGPDLGVVASRTGYVEASTKTGPRTHVSCKMC